MASTLADANNCCTPCESPLTVQVPGPQGVAGADGADGVDGVSPFTTFTALFTIPAELGSAVATVADTSWMVIGQKVYGSRVDGSIHAFFEVTAIGGATSVTLKNLEDAATSAYTENSPPASTLTIGSLLIPAGIQGPTGLISGGVAGGQLKGTYPNPSLAIPNTKGGSVWGNGTDAVEVAAGTNGHMLAYDSTDAEGVKSFKALPLTGDTDLADNRVMRTDGATGLPVPAQPSKVTITDNGAIRADGSGGNARGTDAIDLQVTRAGATQVASGANSTIGGGQNNTASNTSSTVAGGGSNSASGASSTVGGGSSNTASGTTSAVAGGTFNTASDVAAFIGGGQSNTANTNDSTVCGGSGNTAGDNAASNRCFVGGGFGNTASGQESAVVGGSVNTANAANAFVGGGESNIASGNDSTIGGGDSNLASGPNAIIPGGLSAVADKHGQLSHASGSFASAGDAQTFELVLRRATTDATASELFLDGASLRAVIPINTTWAFHLHTVARDSLAATAESAAWEVKGVISNDNGTTSLVAAVTSVTLADDTGGTWVHAVTASDANDALVVTVTGEAGRNIRWVSHIRIVQVTY